MPEGSKRPPRVAEYQAGGIEHDIRQLRDMAADEKAAYGLQSDKAFVWVAGDITDGIHCAADKLSADCGMLAQKKVDLFSDERYAGPAVKATIAGAEGEDGSGSFYSMSVSRG